VREQQKIPIPRSQHWKEFRLRALPGVVFLLTGAVVFQLWSERVTHSNMTGVVVGLAAEIRSPASGYLTQLEVSRFQQVRAGDVIGTVITTDPRLLEARLAVVLAEVELLRHGVGPAATHQRVVLDQDALEMDLMRQRIALSSAELRRQQAEREVQRMQVLHERGLVAEAEYERAQAELGILDGEVRQKTAMIGEMRGRLDRMGNGRAETETAGPIAAAIRRQQEELRLIEAEAMPVTLTAPFDGMVTRILRSNLERVGTDEPILVLRSPRPEYIVAYLPEPLRMNPQVGMPVTIRARANVRREFSGEVVAVGVQIEDMEEVALHASLPTGRAGLPVMVALGDDPPPVRPGEVVQLTLRSGRPPR
jgi:multidrug resistance efflux pump